MSIITILVSAAKLTLNSRLVSVLGIELNSTTNESYATSDRIGFNLNAGRSDSVAPVGVKCIQDKTRWTKALGEAVTFVYGDCTGEIRRSRCSNTADHENTG